MSEEFAGQIQHDAQALIAGEPGGHGPPAIPTSSAARRKRKNAGHVKHEAHSTNARNGADGGQFPDETQPQCAPVRATVDTLIELGRKDAFAIRQRMRVRQATLSHIARTAFGYHTGLTEAERKKAIDAATKLIKSIQGGQDHPLGMLVHATDAASTPWEEIERDTEKAMVKLVRRLPAHEWVQGVRGFGDLSFARIIAETGDLSQYDNPAKVWKRLGLAVFDGRAQRRTRDAEKAVEQGYSPRRRSVSWVAFHSVYLAQSARKDSGGQTPEDAQDDAAAGGEGAGHLVDGTLAGGAGPYRLIYDAKKSEYLERVAAGETGWTKLRADRCAKRYAEKRLLRDLWVAWNRDAGQHDDEAHQSVAGEGDRGGQSLRETQSPRAAPVAADATR